MHDDDHAGDHAATTDEPDGGERADATEDAAPSDARLSARWRAFERGDFRAASAALPLDGLDDEARRRYEAPLRRALRFEPWLVAMAVAGAVGWAVLFTWAQ